VFDKAFNADLRLTLIMTSCNVNDVDNKTNFRSGRGTIRLCE